MINEKKQNKKKKKEQHFDYFTIMSHVMKKSVFRGVKLDKVWQAVLTVILKTRYLLYIRYLTS